MVLVVASQEEVDALVVKAGKVDVEEDLVVVVEDLAVAVAGVVEVSEMVEGEEEGVVVADLVVVVAALVVLVVASVVVTVVKEGLVVALAVIGLLSISPIAAWPNNHPPTYQTRVFLSMYHPSTAPSARTLVLVLLYPFGTGGQS